jgi:hypothetical protein
MDAIASILERAEVCPVAFFIKPFNDQEISRTITASANWISFSISAGIGAFRRWELGISKPPRT